MRNERKESRREKEARRRSRRIELDRRREDKRLIEVLARQGGLTANVIPNRRTPEVTIPLRNAAQSVLSSIINSEADVSFEAYPQLLSERYRRYQSDNYADLYPSYEAAVEASLHLFGIDVGSKVLTQASIPNWLAEMLDGYEVNVTYADLSLTTFNADIYQLEEKIKETDFDLIILDHSSGYMQEISQVKRILDAETASAKILELLGGAPGSAYNDKVAGSFGDASIVNLDRSSMLFSAGSGAILAYNDDFLHQKLHAADNYNSRILALLKGAGVSPIQANIAISQIDTLDERNSRSEANALILNEEVNNIRGLRLPTVKLGYYHTYYDYQVLIDPDSLGVPEERQASFRDDVVLALQEERVPAFAPEPFYAAFQQDLKNATHIQNNSFFISDRRHALYAQNADIIRSYSLALKKIFSIHLDKFLKTATG